MINEGGLLAGLLVSIRADLNLVNQFGGHIESNDVRLVSVSGVVRNGSRYPYIDDVKDDVPLGFDTYDTIFLKDAELSHLGTYYHPELNVSIIENQDKPDRYDARISGDKVYIQASALENINPYWGSKDVNGVFELDVYKTTQVSILAQTNLDISLENSHPNGYGGTLNEQVAYLLNSSALIAQVNQTDQAITKISTELLVNQRYRNLTMFEYEFLVRSKHYDPNSFGHTSPFTIQDDIEQTVKEETFNSVTYAYSPPAGMLFFGDLNLKADFAFVNETSNFESYGLTAFTNGYINDFGIEHGGVKTTQTTYTGSYCVYYEEPSYEAFCQTPEDSNLEVNVSDPRGAPSLFLVNGKIPENTARFRSQTLDSYEGFKEQMVQQAIQDNNPTWWSLGSVTNESTEWYGGELIHKIETKKDSIDSYISEPNDSLVLNYTETTTVIFDYNTRPTTPRVTNEHQVELSFTDELIKFAGQMLQDIQDFFAEFKWWD